MTESAGVSSFVIRHFPATLSAIDNPFLSRQFPSPFPMSLIVQKYGGTSVGNPERILNVARRVIATQEAGHDVVVVVSAMSGVTDGLIKLAKQVSGNPTEREMDVLLATGEQTTIALTAMAINGLGKKGVSLTGAQAGIITDGVHTKAKIANITPKQIHAHLKNGHIVIVAGFQGETTDGRITTLGRGGSDLTAIAIAAAIKADICQIYTDVDGVYTCDPRIVPSARKIDEISYEEMLEMASSGSKVMQSRSVEFAKKFGVVFEVRSSFNNNPGTIVKEEIQEYGKCRRPWRLNRKEPGQGHPPPGARPARHRREDFQRARRRESERGHDRAERQRGRHQRHLVHDQQGRSCQG